MRIAHKPSSHRTARKSREYRTRSKFIALCACHKFPSTRAKAITHIHTIITKKTATTDAARRHRRRRRRRRMHQHIIHWEIECVRYAVPHVCISECRRALTRIPTHTCTHTTTARNNCVTSSARCFSYKSNIGCAHNFYCMHTGFIRDAFSLSLSLALSV